MVLTPLINYILLGVSLWLMATAIRLLIQGGEVASTYSSTFRRLNTYMFLVMFLATIDTFFI
jgi:hypothetical protein